MPAFAMLATACAIGIVVSWATLNPSDWDDLAPGQQAILSPVEPYWDRFGDVQRRRLLRLVERYPGLPEQSQRRITERLLHWELLNQEERASARLTYLWFRSLGPVEQAEIKYRWMLEGYEAFP